MWRLVKINVILVNKRDRFNCLYRFTLPYMRCQQSILWFDLCIRTLANPSWYQLRVKPCGEKCLLPLEILTFVALDEFIHLRGEQKNQSLLEPGVFQEYSLPGTMNTTMCGREDCSPWRIMTYVWPMDVCQLLEFEAISQLLVSNKNPNLLVAFLLMSWVFRFQIFKKTQECMLPVNGSIASSRLTKVLESWPKGFWYKPEYKSIGEGFCRGWELIWQLHNAMRAKGINIKIESPADLHLGALLMISYILICWLFFPALIFLVLSSNGTGLNGWK